MDDYAKENYAIADALVRAAKSLEHEASQLRTRAESLRRSTKRNLQIQKQLGAAPHLVNLLKSEGHKDPITMAAQRLGLAPEVVEWHYANFNKLLSGRERKQRDREIVRLARSGKTNAAIAKETGVSISTVKRAIRMADLGRYSKRPRS